MRTLTSFTRRPAATAAAALAATLMLALPAAQAADAGALSYKVYGFVNAEIESVEAKGGTTPYRQRGRVTDGNSRLGVYSSFAVDAELKAVLQLEASLNNFDQGGIGDNGSTSTLTSRNSYVGLEHVRFGRLLVGNYDSAYRSLVGSGGALGGNLGLSVQGLDLWNNTSAQVSGNAYSVFSRGEARYKNSVHYFSPVWNGLQAAASYGFDESRNGGLNRGRFSLAAKYSLGPLQIGVGLDQQQSTGVDIDKGLQGWGFRTTGQDGANTRFAKIVALYDLPTGTTLGLGVEQARYGFQQFVPPGPGNIYPTLNTGRMNQTGTMASIAQRVGERTTLMASVGTLGRLSNAAVGAPDDYRASQASVGAKLRLNDLLTVYAYGTRIRNHSQQGVNLGQAPLYSANAGSADAYLSPGDSPRAFGVGLIASF
ncbi:porin [Roseateles cellulosilyticus]|uniref:Porin n=1 Tax=Pelomonas cellulosilytica TaxID=2906762 RepID=A0ABS8XVL4_9BURK|nr:porin [Pelomonas sp. P8]MCE4555953.1 porin [Pelomonas sp. P8]